MHARRTIISILLKRQRRRKNIKVLPANGKSNRRRRATLVITRYSILRLYSLDTGLFEERLDLAGWSENNSGS